MSFRYELATENARDLVQNDLCCFIGLTFTLYLKQIFLQLLCLMASIHLKQCAIVGFR